jgi:TusE/DsrC/DsvC family sulfur relay protein
MGQSHLELGIQSRLSLAERKAHRAFARRFWRCCVSYLRRNSSSELVELNIFWGDKFGGLFFVYAGDNNKRLELALDLSAKFNIKRRSYNMPTFEIEGRSFDVDEDGFLQDPTIWDEEVARLFATTEGIAQMTDEHWKVVHYLRNYYLEFNIAPMIRKVCKDTGFKLKKIYELFPSGPAKGACKVAGLPKPTGCV